MSKITHPGRADNRDIAKRIKGWLDKKGFETKAFESDDGFTIKARKASAIRALIGADRALEIDVRYANDQTEVDLRQGSWKTNAISNLAWVVVTGGANLAISGWSLLIQKELEAFVREALSQVSGVREVEL